MGSCKKENEPKAKIIEVTTVQISPKTLSIVEGDSKRLTVTLLPEEAIDKAVIWNSSNEEIATVTEEGLVTAIKEGEVSIIATSNNNLTGTCKLVVSKKVIHVQSISINETMTIMVDVDQVFNLDIKVLPENATNKKIIWTVSNKGLITINEEKKTITGVKKGEVIITVTTEDGNKTDECKVTITPYKVPVISISLSETKIKLKIGDSKLIEAIPLPNIAANKTITWSSSNKGIVTVSKDGLITAIKEGKANIIATAHNGVNKSCEVTVIPESEEIPVEKIILITKCTTLFIGEMALFKVKIVPENATDKKLIWTNSNEDIMDCIENSVCPWDLGEGVITATANNGIKLDIPVKVIEGSNKNGFRISPEITVIAKKNRVLRVENFTGDAKKLKLTYKLSNTNAIKISRWPEGDIKFYKGCPHLEIVEGAKTGDQVTITATDENGKTSSCVATVNLDTDYIYSAFISCDFKKAIKLGESAKLSYKFEDVYPENKDVKFYSLNEDIVTVSDDGTVTAVKVGATAVTVYSLDNGTYSRCNVIVE